MGNMIRNTTGILLWAIPVAVWLLTHIAQASPLVNTSPPVTLPAADGQAALGDALLSLNGGMTQASAIIGDNPTVTPFNGGVSLTGEAFTQDDQYEVVHFSLTQADTVTFTSFGADGGTNGAGAVIPTGGFVPVVALFSGANGQSDDYSTIFSDYGRGTGGVYDVSFAQALAAGDYYVVLSVFNNFDKGFLPTSLVVASPYSNSTFDYAYFNYSVLGDTDNFTYSQLGGFLTGDPTPFWYDSTTQRTGDWALDIITSSLVVPEPGSVWLVLLGLFALGQNRRRSDKACFVCQGKP
ncbi:MAG: DVUA0089 family protein [Proteobacteria bacterium]|nr:DVUA0089 family protein [Pseudomonadota bacterium]